MFLSWCEKALQVWLCSSGFFVYLFKLMAIFKILDMHRFRVCVALMGDFLRIPNPNLYDVQPFEHAACAPIFGLSRFFSASPFRWKLCNVSLAESECAARGGRDRLRAAPVQANMGSFGFDNQIDSSKMILSKIPFVHRSSKAPEF